MKLQVDGTTVYAKLGDVTDSNATSLRVYRNSDNKTYAALKAATEAQEDYQTFTLYTGDPGYEYDIGYKYDYINGCILEPNYINLYDNQYEILALLYSPELDIIGLAVDTSSYESGAIPYHIYLDINGENVELSINYEVSGYYTCDISAYQFGYNETYTIKVVGLSGAII